MWTPGRVGGTDNKSAAPDLRFRLASFIHSVNSQPRLTSQGYCPGGHHRKVSSITQLLQPTIFPSGEFERLCDQHFGLKVWFIWSSRGFFISEQISPPFICQGSTEMCQRTAAQAKLSDDMHDILWMMKSEGKMITWCCQQPRIVQPISNSKIFDWFEQIIKCLHVLSK